MASTNWIGGGDAETYSDPYAGGVANNINTLSNSNLGAQGAATAERAIGRRYQLRDEEIENNPNFGRNAAVSGKLHDNAMAEVGGETSTAYVKGAEADQQAKAQAAQLGIQEGQLQFGINKENYEREQSQTFGNSFVGGLLKSAIGFGVGALEGIGADALNNSINGGGSPDTSGGSGPSVGTPFQPYRSKQPSGQYYRPRTPSFGYGGRGPMPVGATLQD